MSKNKPLHVRVKDTSGAFAGLAVATAAAFKAAAWMLAPTGLAALAIAFGLKSPPLIIVAIPFIIIICTAVGAFAGFARFYSWCKTRSE